jgi:hypothetical protein
MALLLFAQQGHCCSCPQTLPRDAKNFFNAKVLEAKFNEKTHTVIYRVTIVYQFKDTIRRFQTGANLTLMTNSSSASCGSGMYVGREYWIDMSEFPNFHSCSPPQGAADPYAIELHRRRMLETANLTPGQ